MKKVLSVGTAAAALFVSASSAFAASINLERPSQYAGAQAIDANQLVGFIINGLVVVGIIASLIWLLYGGLRWIISGGDKAKVDAARGTIVAAIVGLIIVILAWVIINTVLVVLTSHGLTDFQLPTLGPTPTITPKPPGI